jgi:hypothetical protein
MTMPQAHLTLTVPDGVWIGDVSRPHPDEQFRIPAALVTIRQTLDSPKSLHSNSLRFSPRSTLAMKSLNSTSFKNTTTPR